MNYKYIIKLNIDEFPIIGNEDLVAFLFGYLYEELNQVEVSSLDAEFEPSTGYIKLFTNNRLNQVTLNNLINSNKVDTLFDIDLQKIYKGTLFNQDFSKDVYKSNKELIRIDGLINKVANKIYKELRKIDRGLGDKSNLSILVYSLNNYIDEKLNILKSINSDGGLIDIPIVNKSIDNIRDKARAYLAKLPSETCEGVISLVPKSSYIKSIKLKEFSDRLRRLN